MANSSALRDHRLRSRWWHALTAYQPGESGWPSAIRRGGLVGVIALVGAATGTYAELAIVAMGALNVGLVSGAVPRDTLRRALVAVTLVGSAVAGVAALLAGTWWTVPLLVLLAYLVGAYSSRGLVAFNTTFMSLLLAVIFTNSPSDLAGAVKIAGLILAGSALQTILSIVTWRYECESTIRRSIGLAIREIVRSVGTVDEDLSAKLSAIRFMGKAQTDLAGARLTADRHELYATVVAELNWTRLCINAWLLVGHPTTAERESVVTELHGIDALVRRRISPVGTQALAVSAADPAWTDVVDQLATLRTAVNELRSTTSTKSAVPKSPSPRGTSHKHWRVSPAALRTSLALLLPGSVGFRHAMRLSLAIGCAQILALAGEVPRGYWIPLTVVMVVKPDFSTTFIRGILRIVGTILAILVIGSILIASGGTAWIMAGLVLVTAPLTMRWINANYAFGAFAITSTVLLLVEAGSPSAETFVLRLQNTLIGVAIGAIAYLIIPSWNTDRVLDLLRHVLATQRIWTLHTVAALNSDSPDLAALRSEGERARNAVVAARPVIEAASLEPSHKYVDAVAAVDLLDACERAAIASTSLEVQLHSRDENVLRISPEIVERLDADFTATAAALDRVDSPAGSTPPQGVVRTAIDEIDDVRLRRTVMALTADVDTAAGLARRVPAT